MFPKLRFTHRLFRTKEVACIYAGLESAVRLTKNIIPIDIATNRKIYVIHLLLPVKR